MRLPAGAQQAACDPPHLAAQQAETRRACRHAQSKARGYPAPHSPQKLARWYAARCWVIAAVPYFSVAEQEAGNRCPATGRAFEARQGE